MKHFGFFQFTALFFFSLLLAHSLRAENEAKTSSQQAFTVKGVIQEIKLKDNTLIIRHEAIPDYMPAMTMPFRVRGATNLSVFKPGDEISFRLMATDSEGWIEQIKKIGNAEKSVEANVTSLPPLQKLQLGDAMLDYTLTNELGKAVRFSDYRGQAYAFTFMFTRCPFPEFCPRLAKNFEEATKKLAAITNATANWHFFSITFDPEFDTPQVLKAYGEKYNYDPKHWSFLTGSKQMMEQMAKQFGFNYKPDIGLFNHNFITVVVNTNGILQSAWPVSGDTSGNLVKEILKAVQPAPEN